MLSSMVSFNVSRSTIVLSFLLMSSEITTTKSRWHKVQVDSLALPPRWKRGFFMSTMIVTTGETGTLSQDSDFFVWLWWKKHTCQCDFGVSFLNSFASERRQTTNHLLFFQEKPMRMCVNFASCLIKHHPTLHNTNKKKLYIPSSSSTISGIG